MNLDRTFEASEKMKYLMARCCRNLTFYLPSTYFWFEPVLLTLTIDCESLLEKNQNLSLGFFSFCVDMQSRVSAFLDTFFVYSGPAWKYNLPLPFSQTFAIEEKSLHMAVNEKLNSNRNIGPPQSLCMKISAFSSAYCPRYFNEFSYL